MISVTYYYITRLKSFFKGIKMKSYTLKSIGKNTDYMTIVREMEDGFVVKIVRDLDGYEDIKTDYISRELFDSCIRTGYLTEIKEKVAVAAN